MAWQAMQFLAVASAWSARAGADTAARAASANRARLIIRDLDRLGYSAFNAIVGSRVDPPLAPGQCWRTNVSAWYRDHPAADEISRDRPGGDVAVVGGAVALCAGGGVVDLGRLVRLHQAQ